MHFPLFFLTPMKILHVISSLETGGAQKLVGDLLPIFNRKPGVEASVVVFRLTGSDIEKRLLDAGIKVISIDSGLLSAKAVARLIPLMKEADLVHVHLFPTNYMVAAANMVARKPLVFTEHSTHNRRRDRKWLRPFEKAMYFNYSVIACISGATADALTKWIGHRIADSRIEIIENGIDLDSFHNAPEEDPVEVFGKEGVPVLMVSRFTASKDHAALVRALARIKRNDVYVVFVGDGETRKEIEDLAHKLGVADRVVFMGIRHDMPRIVKAAKIGVQASNWEGFGLTAVEMMAGGIPVIASDVDGLRQVVEGAGIIFPKNNDKALAQEIMCLIDHPPTNETLETGHIRAACYSIHKTAANYLELYKSLMK